MRFEAAVREQTGRDLPPITVVSPIAAGSEQTGVTLGADYEPLSVFRGELLHRTAHVDDSELCCHDLLFRIQRVVALAAGGAGRGVTKSLVYTAFIALSYPIAPFASACFADRVERKWQIAAGSTVVVIAGLLFCRANAVAGWLIFGLLVTVGGHLTSTATHTYRTQRSIRRASGLAASESCIQSIDWPRPSTVISSGSSWSAVGPTAVLVFIAVMSSIVVADCRNCGSSRRGLASEAIRNRLSRGTGVARRDDSATLVLMLMRKINLYTSRGIEQPAPINSAVLSSLVK